MAAFAHDRKNTTRPANQTTETKTRTRPQDTECEVCFPFQV